MPSPAPLRAACALALLLAGVPTGAGSTAYVYGLNPSGKLTVNGTVLEELPGEFAIEDGVVKGTDDAWVALEVEGPDRYSLRYDGVLRVNGKKKYALPFAYGTRWAGMDVEDGHVFCLRSDGLLALDGKVVADLPAEEFAFRRVVVLQGRAYSLRYDGSLFRDGGTQPAGRFRAGPGRGTGQDDGLANDSAWVDAVVNPLVPEVLALRGDGILQSLPLSALGEPGVALGTEEAALPFVYDLDADGDGALDRFPLLDDTYTDVEVDGNGAWLVLAADGRVYGRDSGLVPLDDFPGDAVDPDSAFPDMALLGADRWALRGDGRVYRGGSESPALSLAGLHYGMLAVSADAPDLGSFDEHKPKCVTFEVTVVAGTPVLLPAMPTDIETRSADLVLAPGDLPFDSSGSESFWDAAARTLRWDAPQVAGNYKFQLSVSDGKTATVTVTHRIHVVDPDADPEKNRKPALPAVKNARPVIGQPFSFPVILDDRDGDAVSVGVDLAEYPFTAGAIFDPATRVFSWTPAPEDQGDRKVRFRVYDGTAEQTKTVILKVRSGLIF